MNTSFRKTNYETIDDSLFIAKWHGDPSIRHFVIPQRNEESLLLSPESAETIRERYKPGKPNGFATDEMILADGEKK